MNIKNKSAKFLGARVISPLENTSLRGGKMNHQRQQINGGQGQQQIQDGQGQQQQEIQNAF